MIDPLTLELLESEWSIARLAPDDPVPDWAWSAELCSVSRTCDELSVLAPSAQVPDDVRCERAFRAMIVQGPLPFDAKGILADLSAAIAEAGISLLAISTFDTDVVLVRQDDLDAAVAALHRRGHAIT